MEGWFPGPSERDIIDGRVVFCQKGPDLFENILNGNIFFPFQCLVRCFSDLAIDAVIRTNLMGDEIDSKRTPESPGWNRSV
jgi:ABC-type iron transport system FetAB ATPase subunit